MIRGVTLLWLTCQLMVKSPPPPHGTPHSLDLISALSLWHWSTENNLWTHCVFLASSIIPHTCVSISAIVRRFTPVPIPPAWPCRVMQSINHCSHHLTGVVWYTKGNNCPWHELLAYFPLQPRGHFALNTNSVIYPSDHVDILHYTWTQDLSALPATWPLSGC